MRLWSIHPKYLDTKGLIALWREALLAKHVLEGNTIGYKNHPQLIRFKNSIDPIYFINKYLFFVWEEAKKRGYNFDDSKYNYIEKYQNQITVTKGQLVYEQHHLLNKLKMRDPLLYSKLKEIELFSANPIFNIIDGDIEPWEKIK